MRPYRALINYSKMGNLLDNQKVIKIFRLLRPWLTFAIIFLILKYTGALSNISVYTSTALMKTGALDVSTDNRPSEEQFNYNFTIKDLKGNTVDFNQFKGKTVFLNLWATWCGPCRAEMPSIQSLYEKMNKDKVVFVMLDWFEDAKKTSNYIDGKKFTFPVYLVNNDVPEQLNVSSIPTTFVISPSGEIATKKTGTTNYDTEKFKKFLEELK